MADRFKITVRGVTRAIQRLKSLGGNINKEIAPALFTEMDVEVAGRAKEEFVPVDKGVLKGSIHTTKPKFRRGSVSVSVVAGGPAKDYALAVHENLTARHPVGQAKYLETPFLQAQLSIKQAILKALGRAIEKR